MSWVYAAKLRELKADLEEGGYLERAQYYCNLIYTKTVITAFILQGYGSQLVQLVVSPPSVCTSKQKHKITENASREMAMC